MPTIACPKCQTKYKLPESALGKPVKCQKCAATFRTQAPQQAVGQPANAPSGGGQQGSPEDLARLGIDGPLKRQADIFSAPPPQQRANPLGNFVLEDPGFADVDLARQEAYAEEGLDDGMSSILANPYAASKSNQTKKPRKNWGEGDPNYAYGSLTLWAILTSIGVAIEALFWVVAPLILWGLIAAIPEDPEAVDEETMLGLLMALGLTLLLIFLAWMANSLFTAISFFIYIFKANCNVRALGAKGLKNSPGMCIGWWFIPIMNTFKPLQAIVEVCKATERPRGKSWEKLPTPTKFTTGWSFHGLGWIPLAILIFFDIQNFWILISLFVVGVVSHLAGAVILILVMFDVSKKQNEHALDKYGSI